MKNFMVSDLRLFYPHSGDCLRTDVRAINRSFPGTFTKIKLRTNLSKFRINLDFEDEDEYQLFLFRMFVHFTYQRKCWISKKQLAELTEIPTTELDNLISCCGLHTEVQDNEEICYVTVDSHYHCLHLPMQVSQSEIPKETPPTPEAITKPIPQMEVIPLAILMKPLKISTSGVRELMSILPTSTIQRIAKDLQDLKYSKELLGL